jgi:hypothetical protein
MDEKNFILVHCFHAYNKVQQQNLTTLEIFPWSFIYYSKGLFRGMG